VGLKKATLDEDPKVQGPNEIVQSYWMRAIKVDPWPLDEDGGPKSGKLRLNLCSLDYSGLPSKEGLKVYVV